MSTTETTTLAMKIVLPDDFDGDVLEVLEFFEKGSLSNTAMVAMGNFHREFLGKYGAVEVTGVSGPTIEVVTERIFIFNSSGEDSKVATLTWQVRFKPIDAGEPRW